jgi:sugar lactone lactonase YvrE
MVGNHVVRQVTFTGQPGLPEVTGIAPFSGIQGTVIPANISGSALTGATDVTFSGSGVTASLQPGGTDMDLPISITVDAGASPGVRTFSVTTADGTSESFSGFTVVNSVIPPSITSINPLKGVIGASIPALVTGSGLTGATAVTFSGTGVTASIESGATDTSLPITVSIAANATLDLRVLTVTTPAGTSPAYNGFTVVRPTITGISNSRGTQGFSLPVTLSGANLVGATLVSFTGSGVSAAIFGVTDTQVKLLVTVAADAAPGVRDITVAAAGAISQPFTGFTIHTLGPSGVITTFAGDGTTPFKGDGGPAVEAGLYFPQHVAADLAGNVYIADPNHYRVRKVDGNGVITTVAGSGSYGFEGDGGPAVFAGLSEPSGLVVDGSGNLFIVDRGHNRVRMVTQSGVISTVVGTGVPGYSGDGGQALQAQIQSPRGLARDSSGNLYIADAGNHRIRKVAANGVISTVAGNGQSGFAGDNGQATTAFLSSPSGIAVDAAGTLFIADLGNNRIRKVTTDGVITTIAGSANTGFSGDGGPASFAQLHTPVNVTVDGLGNLYISDLGNRRVRKINASGTITTAAGNGDFGAFYGDGGPAISSSVLPTDVAVDASGNLFIADYDHNRVRKVSFAPPSPRKARGQITSQ